MNNGQIILLACILCSAFTTASKLCPDDSKDVCNYASSSINCIICVYVLLKLFNIL